MPCAQKFTEKHLCPSSTGSYSELSYACIVKSDEFPHNSIWATDATTELHATAPGLLHKGCVCGKLSQYSFFPA